MGGSGLQGLRSHRRPGDRPPRSPAPVRPVRLSLLGGPSGSRGGGSQESGHHPLGCRRAIQPLRRASLEVKLRENHAAWTEDLLWNAFAIARPNRVKGRSQAGRFADLVALVRFALEQQPVLEPFAESVHQRFQEWLTAKAKTGVDFTPEQLAWLSLIRDHIATAANIEADEVSAVALLQTRPRRTPQTPRRPDSRSPSRKAGAFRSLAVSPPRSGAALRLAVVTRFTQPVEFRSSVP